MLVAIVHAQHISSGKMPVYLFLHDMSWNQHKDSLIHDDKNGLKENVLCILIVGM